MRAEREPNGLRGSYMDFDNFHLLIANSDFVTICDFFDEKKLIFKLFAGTCKAVSHRWC